MEKLQIILIFGVIILTIGLVLFAQTLRVSEVKNTAVNIPTITIPDEIYSNPDSIVPMLSIKPHETNLSLKRSMPVEISSQKHTHKHAHVESVSETSNELCAEWPAWHSKTPRY